MANILHKIIGNEESNENNIQLPTDDVDNSSNSNTNHHNNNNNNFFFKNFKNIYNSMPSIGLDGSYYDNYDIENEEVVESNFNLSYFEKISIFIICMIGCYGCYSICFIFFPILILKPKKFSLLWTIGSTSFLTGFGILNGPKKFIKHLLSKERVIFSIVFVGSIIMTFIFTLVIKNNLLVIISCAIQAIASIFYIVSYFPYGRQGLRLTSGMARDQAQSWLGV